MTKRKIESGKDIITYDDRFEYHSIRAYAEVLGILDEDLEITLYEIMKAHYNSLIKHTDIYFDEDSEGVVDIEVKTKESLLTFQDACKEIRGINKIMIYLSMGYKLNPFIFFIFIKMREATLSENPIDWDFSKLESEVAHNLITQIKNLYVKV